MTAPRIGLVGSDIGTSLSPALHEREAAELGIDGYRYETLDLEVLGRSPHDAGTLVREAAAAGYTGFNVTHPCKQTVIGGLDALTPDAAALGAVNTVVVDDGRLVGHNTDHSGFAAAFDANLAGAPLDRVVLVGAGGAGAAVGHALCAAGVRRLAISDLVPERATQLAERLAATHPAVALVAVAHADVAAEIAGADGVAHASPAGMVGFGGTPFDTAALAARAWVADVVYRPVATPLLVAARARGCRTLDGAQMLVAQAADTFALVTRTEPDRARMHQHLHDLLAARTALAS